MLFFVGFLLGFDFVFEFFFEVGELFFFFRGMVEVAVVAFVAASFHVEDAVFPVFSEMDEGAVLFFAGPSFEVPADFSPLHDSVIL